MHATAVQIGAAVAGPLTEFLQTMQPIVATVVEFIRNNPDLVRSVAAITAVMGAASIASYGLGTAFTFLSMQPVLRTLILITTARVALNEAVKNASDWLSGDDAWAEQKRAEFASIKETLDEVGRESLMNAQLASRADLLAPFDDAQLQAWATDLMGGEPFVCEMPKRQWIEGLLAASSLAQEMQRRRDVETLEDEAAGA